MSEEREKGALILLPTEVDEALSKMMGNWDECPEYMRPAFRAAYINGYHDGVKALATNIGFDIKVEKKDWNKDTKPC